MVAVAAVAVLDLALPHSWGSLRSRPQVCLLLVAVVEMGDRLHRQDRAVRGKPPLGCDRNPGGPAKAARRHMCHRAHANCSCRRVVANLSEHKAAQRQRQIESWRGPNPLRERRRMV